MEFEFENICIDCKKRGYSVGFTFKRISYKGLEVLDMPQKYMDGATLAFDLDGKTHVIHSIEKIIQQDGDKDAEIKTDFMLIKRIQSETRHKFTFFSNVLQIPNILDICLEPLSKNNLQLNGIYYLMDIYTDKNSPFIIIFLTLINNTDKPLHNVNIYWFIDFDIHGQLNNDSDAFMLLDKNSIVMYDTKDDQTKRLYAGLSTIEEKYEIGISGGDPNNILPNFPDRNPKFDIGSSPGDYALGISWKNDFLEPKKSMVVPLAIFCAIGDNEVQTNKQNAQEKIKEYSKYHLDLEYDDKRFLIDNSYSKINTSINKWCKND